MSCSHSFHRGSCSHSLKPARGPLSMEMPKGPAEEAMTEGAMTDDRAQGHTCPPADPAAWSTTRLTASLWLSSSFLKQVPSDCEKPQQAHVLSLNTEECLILALIPARMAASSIYELQNSHLVINAVIIGCKTKEKEGKNGG